MKEPIHIRLPLYAKVALILISLALIVVTLKLGHGILVPLAFAFLFAMLLHPLCVRLEALKVPRILAIFTCLIAIMLAIGLILYFITAQIMRFSQDIPELQARFNEIVNELQNYVDDTFGIARSNQASLFRQSVDQLVQSSGTILTGTLAATTNMFADLTLIPIFIFFFLYYRTFFKQFLFKLFSNTPHQEISRIMIKIQSVVKNYIMGLLLVMVIIAALNTVGLLILDIRYALFFGTLAAFLNIIPYLGIIIGSALPIIMALLTKDTIWYAVGVAGVFAFVQFLEGNFITPNVVGSKVSVNPLAAILALILGGVIWGISGMILSIPFTAITKVIMDNIEPLEPFGFLLGEPPLPPDRNPQGDFIYDTKEEIKNEIQNTLNE